MQTLYLPVISGIVFFVIEILKSAFPSEKFKRFLPLVAGLLGAGLGVATYFIPSINVASNILDAILIGLMSGLTATGTHQIYKQMSDKWFFYVLGMKKIVNF